MKGSYDQSICSSLLLHFCFLFSFFSLCFFFFCIFLVTLFPLSIFYAFFLLYKYLESRFSFLLVMEMDFDAFFHSSSLIQPMEIEIYALFLRTIFLPPHPSTPFLFFFLFWFCFTLIFFLFI